MPLKKSNSNLTKEGEVTPPHIDKEGQFEPFRSIWSDFQALMEVGGCGVVVLGLPVVSHGQGY